MKRLVLSACIVVLSVTAASAAPAGAVRVKLTGIERGAIIEGGVSFQAEAASPAGIKKLQIAIDDAVVASVEPSNLRQEVELPYDWATMFRRDSTELAPNGGYTIKAIAVANGDAVEEVLAKVIVDNPASIPTGLTATPGSEQVALRWDPNPEPDILGYQVERLDAGSFAIVGETTGTSFVDAVDPGDHSYRIVAVRNSAARSTGRPSLPTSEVTVSVAAASKDAKGNPRFGVGPAPAGDPARDFGDVGGGSFAARGLPSGAALPGSVGLPSIPNAPGASDPRWGAYDETLPYDIPDGGIPLSASSDREMGQTWTLLPADGLRWVAMGCFLLAIAALLRLVARRLELIAGPPELKL